MENLTKKAIVIGLLGFVVLTAVALTYEVGIGYPVYLDNCNSILGTQHQVATEDVSGCLKAINHPFINYWLEFIVIMLMLNAMVGFGIGFLYWAYRDYNDDF